MNECTFFLSDTANKQHCRYCFRHKGQKKIHLWAYISENDVMSSMFIEGNLTGGLFLCLIENIVKPSITTPLGDQVRGKILQENETYFLDNGALPHFCRPV